MFVVIGDDYGDAERPDMHSHAERGNEDEYEIY